MRTLMLEPSLPPLYLKDSVYVVSSLRLARAPNIVFTNIPPVSERLAPSLSEDSSLNAIGESCSHFSSVDEELAMPVSLTPLPQPYSLQP